MSALIRCPQCDTFIKTESLTKGVCPFCPSSRVATRSVPALVLAASLAVASGCSDTTPIVDAGIDASAVYGIAPDASPVDAQPGPDAQPTTDANAIAPPEDDER